MPVDVSNNITLTESVTIQLTCSNYSSDRCSGGTASASSIYGAGNEADKAFDNDTEANLWAANDPPSFPEWIKYDFGSGNSYKITKIRAHPYSDGADTRLKDFKVQYSDNDSDWFDAGEFQCPDNGKQWYDFAFMSVGKHRYWRLLISSTWDGDFPGIWEIEMLECLDIVDVEASDSFTVSDNTNFQIEDFEPFFEIDVSDAITASDSITAQIFDKIIPIDVSDTISLSESSHLLTEGIISDNFELTDYIDAYNLTDTLTDGFTLTDTIDRDFEAFRGIQDDFELSDEIDALNWSKWFRDNADRAVKVYYLTVTGAADSTTDVEIPMESFQGRKRTGYATYLSAVVPFEYAAQLTARSNGQIVVDMAYKIGSEISLREEIIRADIDDIRIDEGSRHGSITIFGYQTVTYASQAITIPEPIYRNVTDGKLRYRFGTPDPYLNPGDVATVGEDQFTVDSISYVVSARQQSMEIAEA